MAELAIDAANAPRRPKSNCLVIPDERTLAALVRTVAGAREGERNQIAFWAACRLGEMAATRLLDLQYTAGLLVEAAVQAGLPRQEAERTVHSGGLR